jgi:hypothetical protein
LLDYEQGKMKMRKIIGYLGIVLLVSAAALAQSVKPKSYIISKEEYYTIDVKANKPSIVAFAQEKKWVGDKEDSFVKGNRINYTASFEDVTDIEAFSVSPRKKKEKVKNIMTEDVEIEDIFYHDMKFKYYFFPSLEEGSETYTSFRKEFRQPHFLDAFYFRDGLDVKNAKLELKVSKNVEIGYVLQGADIDKIQFTTTPDGEFTKYTWQMLDSKPDESFSDAPSRSYYSPHLIFYIKNYKTEKGTQDVVGSIENLYKFYYQTVKDINKKDQTALQHFTLDLIKNINSDFEKTRAIFNYVQSKVNYVAFEDGMGGFIPREAADVFNKKYGDCKDMANLLNEMLKYAGVESYTACIGTRHNNYTYEKVPTPIVDNHMIAVAKINGEYIFLDATGQFTLFPGFTAFIQGKQALLKVDEKNYKIVQVPIIAADENNTNGKMAIAFDGGKLTGTADFRLTGYTKSQFNGYYKSTIDKTDMLKNYLARFINSINTSNIQIAHDDLTQDALEIKYDFSLDKWVKTAGEQLIFKPVLFFPFSDSRIDTEKRKVPLEFQFNKSFDFEYEIAVPEGYKVEFIPGNFNLKTDLIEADMQYTAGGNKIIVRQKIATNVLLLEKAQFDAWNAAIKSITKQYNQNIIFTKAQP